VTGSKELELSGEPEGAITVIRRTGSCVSERNWNLVKILPRAIP
jgi:hypothetical protein